MRSRAGGGVANLRRHGVRLAGETSIQIGGQAREYWVPATVGEFARLVAENSARRPFILGGGCNTLFPDGTFDRPVISTERLRRVEIGEDRVRAESGVGIGFLVRSAIEAGLGGIETFVGIPGTVGGAVVMNAGGSGRFFGDFVIELGLIEVDTGEIVVRSGDEVPWGYRSWNLSEYAVAWVTLQLTPADTIELRRCSAEHFRRKRDSQPLAHPSSGCVFKNPPGRAAAALIDSLGLKGLRRGGAMVSEHHANFIVNREGRACSDDVKALIDEIRSRVETAYGIRLETEIVLAEEI